MTVSSAPEQQGIDYNHNNTKLLMIGHTIDVIWLHIRAVGQWTNRVYNHFNMESNIRTSHVLDCRLHQRAKREIQEKEDKSDNYEMSPTMKRQRSSTFSVKSDSSSLNSHMLKDAKVMILPVPADCDAEFGCGKQAMAKKKRADDIEMATSSVDVSKLSPFNIPLDEGQLRKNAIILDKPLKVRLDGPYGSPSSHIFHTQHAILIATGIGVTPFASILQSIMLRYMEAKRSCPACSHSWSDPIPPNVMKLRKVDFMWINRDYTSFEWFVTLLSELERQQEKLHEKDRFLDIHMHITQGSVKQRRPSFSIDGKELVNRTTELKDGLTWHKGRPDWNKFFKQMSDRKKGRITVFFCGRNDLARSLKLVCNQFGFQFRKEVF